MYKVSVIIPVYNTQQYLDECIQSVLNQTLDEVEVILVDDGSNDHSYEIMCSYEHGYENVKVFQQENKKLGAARNLGLKNATGKYIFFLDSDDYIRRNCLEILYDCAEKNNLDLVTFDADTLVEQVDSKVKVTYYNRSKLGIEPKRIYCGMDFLNQYFWRGGAYVSACLSCYRASFLKGHQLFFTEQVYYEDNEFSLRVYKNAKRMMYVPQMFYVRRYRAHSIMTSKCGITHLQSALKMNEKCLKILLEWPDTGNTIEGPRGVIAILASRLIKQLQEREKPYYNPYIYEFCSFFVECDIKKMLSHMGLGLAIDYYNVFSQMIKRGYLNDNLELQENVNTRNRRLRNKIKRKLDELIRSLQTMGEAGGKVVIYGTGDIAEKMINSFESIYEKPITFENKVIFANTKVQQGMMYLDKFPIRSINDLENYSISVIIVASTNYEYDMCETLRKLYEKKYTFITYREMANYSVNV